MRCLFIFFQVLQLLLHYIHTHIRVFSSFAPAAVFCSERYKRLRIFVVVCLMLSSCRACAFACTCAACLTNRTEPQKDSAGSSWLSLLKGMQATLATKKFSQVRVCACVRLTKVSIDRELAADAYATSLSTNMRQCAVYFLFELVDWLMEC